jgi:hypothetical protein
MSIEKYHILWLQADGDAGKLPDCKALKAMKKRVFRSAATDPAGTGC